MNSAIPVQIGYETHWNKISGGTYHSIAIKDDGTLWAWGLNSTGTLGDGTTINRNIATQIGTSNEWIQISGGGNQTLALKQNGTLWAFGGILLGS